MDKTRELPEWAQRLKALRAHNGMTQSHLARMIGVTQSAVAQWERAAAKPTPMAFVAIARIAVQDRDWWWKQAGAHHEVVEGTLERWRETHVGNASAAIVPLLKDAAAAGTPRAIDEREIEAELVFPRQWVGRSSTITAIRIEGDSMAPILEPGYIVLVDTSQRDPKKLINQMVAARADDGVTIKWLRREKSRGEEMYLLVAHHTSIRHPVRIIAEGSDSVSIVGKVVKWIGEPPSPRK